MFKRVRTKIRLRLNKLAYLVPVVVLGISLSGGITYATSPGYAADGILGQSSYTTNNSGYAAGQLYYPSSTVIDTVHHRLFVADFYNDRVLIYQLNNNDQIESQDPSYALGAANTSSQGTDTVNNNSFETAPYAMTYDPVNDRLFVMDYYRVLVFDLAGGVSNDMAASYVIGEPDFSSEIETTTINGLDAPGYYGGGLAFDQTNDRLFVSDYTRILVFNVSPSTLATNGNGENASYVIGQTNFTNQNIACTQSELGYGFYDEAAVSLAFDNANQRLFVDDGDYCSRVLVFNVSPSTLATNGNGENASYVIGQTNFTNAGYGTNQKTFDTPGEIGYDPTNNSLFVGDYYGNRIMLFNVSTSTIADYENAYAVIGQPDFTSLNDGDSQTELGYSYYGAGGFAIDPTDNQLFLPDEDNNRVLTYNFISITNSSSLASATAGSSYSQTLQTANSQGTVTFAVTGGSLPPGLSLNASTGTISGTPTTSGSYTFEITAYDNVGTAGTFEDDPSYTITVANAATTSTTSPDTGYGKPVNYAPLYVLLAVSFIAVAIGTTALILKKKRLTN